MHAINVSKEYAFTCFITASILFLACSKGDDASVTPTGLVIPPNPCAGKTLTLLANSTTTLPCVNNGSVTITASGSLGFTYSIDGSGFQASNVFNNLGPGDHTYLVKDRDGCSKSASANVGTLLPGPIFKAFKAVIVANCITCHSGASPGGGRDFTNDCVILNAAGLFKAKVIDTNTHYVLSNADKNTILDWIYAGSKYNY
ncbi:MAG: hypothetical protein NVSMB63_03660 [Sediminibacterium sp.]